MLNKWSSLSPPPPSAAQHTYYVQLCLWKTSSRLGESNWTNWDIASILFLEIWFVTYILQCALNPFPCCPAVWNARHISVPNVSLTHLCPPPKTMRCWGVIEQNLNNNSGFLLKMKGSAWKVIYPCFAEWRALKGHSGRETVNCLENSQFDYNGQFRAYSLLVSILPKVASFVITTVLQKHCGRDHKPSF